MHTLVKSSDSQTPSIIQNAFYMLAAAMLLTTCIPQLRCVHGADRHDHRAQIPPAAAWLCTPQYVASRRFALQPDIRLTFIRYRLVMYGFIPRNKNLFLFRFLTCASRYFGITAALDPLLVLLVDACAQTWYVPNFERVFALFFVLCTT